MNNTGVQDIQVSNDECYLELAAIFAAGILRLHARNALTGETPRIAQSNSTLPGLEVPDETVLTVHTG